MHSPDPSSTVSIATRTRILHALHESIVHQDLRAVTLGGVADAAGVSKGGLLHHFPNKNAMINALVNYLRELAFSDLHDVEQTDDLVRMCLGSERESSHTVLASLITTLGLPDAQHQQIRRDIDDILMAWEDALTKALGDRVLAGIVRLAADGLCFRVLVGSALPEDVVQLRHAITRLQACPDSSVGSRARPTA